MVDAPERDPEVMKVCEPIIHAYIEKEWDDLVIKGKKHKHKLYLCNQAVIASEEKITDVRRKINCKNCMKILKINPGLRLW